MVRSRMHHDFRQFRSILVPSDDWRSCQPDRESHEGYEAVEFSGAPRKTNRVPVLRAKTKAKHMALQALIVQGKCHCIYTHHSSLAEDN